MSGSNPGEGTLSLSVRHRTAFKYGTSVRSSVNTLHLEPRDFRSQKTLQAIIKVIPATRLRRSEDLFGNVAHHFELSCIHSRLEIESLLKVRNLPLDISNEGYSRGMDFYQYLENPEKYVLYMGSSGLVSTSAAVREAAMDITLGENPVFEKAHAIMRWINASFEYAPGTTGVDTHPDESFEMRKGVCQDFTHVMLGMCRAIGIPARYVSGYIYTGEKDSLIGAQASHAWCDVLLPDSGWTGFDPTNAVLADQRYIRLAVGRDYQDVAPVQGTYVGASDCLMEVEVAVFRT